MQAVILAAGKSERFKPFPEKSLTTLFGKTILEHTLLSLKKVGIHDVVIVVPENSLIPTVIGDGKHLDIQIKYVVHKGAQGMGQALLDTKDLLDDTFFVLGPHHLEIDTFIRDMIGLQHSKETIVLLSKPGQKNNAYGYIETKNDKVVGIVEKPKAIDDSFQQIVAIYLLNKSFISTLQQTPAEHYSFEKAISSYIKTENVTFLSTDKKALTLKYPWDLLEIKDYLLSHVKRSISRKADIAKSAILDGNVYVSDGVRILENAVIKGPCWLGENVTVGTNAILRNGVVAEKDVVVGANMEVKNSLLMESVTTHTGYIGDSIIGEFSRLAGGFCSANVRFDRGHIMSVVKNVETDTNKTHFGVILGSHVDTGVNVCTMPGIIIGNNVTVGPSTNVMKNIEDNSLVYTKFETVVKSIRQAQDDTNE